MKISADVVIFDQGNTLLLDPFQNTLVSVKDKISEILEKFDISITTDKLYKAWKKSNKEIDYPNCSHFWQEEPIISNALDNLKIDNQKNDILSLEILKAYRMEFKKIVKNDKRNKIVKETIEGLAAKGKRFGVFSNDRKIDLINNLQLIGILKYFEYIYSSEELGFEKPNPIVFKHMLTYFKKPKNKIVYIGDDPVRDIEAAKKFGFKAVLYKVNQKYQENWRNYKVKIKHKPDMIIEKFSEILKIIE